MCAITTLFVAFLSITANCLGQTTTATYPLPLPCTGPACSNPVVNGSSQLDYQDFSVIRRGDGTYFRYSKCNSTGDGLSVATAPALSGPWNYAFEVLDGPLLSEVSTTYGRENVNVWAPEVHFINDLYYLFYGVNGPDFTFDLCVATSTSMDVDTWTDHGSMNVPLAPTVTVTPSGSTPTPTPAYVRLDGSLMARARDPSGVAGRHYMVFGSYQIGLYGFPVSHDFLTIVPGGTVEEVIIDQLNPASPDKTYAAGNKTEGSYMLIHGEWIYLFYSIGDCCAPPSYGANVVYRVEVCRADVHGEPSGPYLDREGNDCLTGSVNRTGTVVLYSSPDGQVYAPGSVGVLDDPTEGLVMYYQYQNNTAAIQPPGLNFGYNYLEIDEEAWPLLVAERS